MFILTMEDGRLRDTDPTVQNAINIGVAIKAGRQVPVAASDDAAAAQNGDGGRRLETSSADQDAFDGAELYSWSVTEAEPPKPKFFALLAMINFSAVCVAMLLLLVLIIRRFLSTDRMK